MLHVLGLIGLALVLLYVGGVVLISFGLMIFWPFALLDPQNNDPADWPKQILLWPLYAVGLLK